MIEWGLLSLLLGLGITATAVALHPLGLTIKKQLFYMVFILGLVFIGYWQWGGFESLKLHHLKQSKIDTANKRLTEMGGPQALVKAMLEKLKANPESSEGWFLLGRLYMTQLSYANAREAFAHAHKLSPEDVNITINYAESTWAMNKESLDDESRLLLESLLQQNPDQTDALAMLGMDAYKHHNYKAAIGYWEHLLKFLPQQSDEASAIRKALVKARNR